MWDYCDWGWGWHGWGMGMLGLVGLLVLAVLVVAVVRWAPRASQPSAGGTDSPLDVLKKRYARGEIGAEEFSRIKRELVE